MNQLWPWLILFGLGAFHGLNPAMGWLFALSLGLQEKNRAAVLRALPPIALGHALAVGLIVSIVLIARASVPQSVLRIGAASALLGFGLYRLVRMRHPRWVGMRVNSRDLTLWSFLMASAHGAGLMLLPLFVGNQSPAWSHATGIASGLSVEPFCSASLAPFSSSRLLVCSVAVHTAGHLLVAGVLALVVYEKLGLGFLRKAWLNVDLIWIIALIGTGLAIFFI